MKNILLFFSMLPLFAQSQISDALKLRVAFNGYQDETVIRFLSGASSDFDGNYDAFKFFSPNPSVPSLFTRLDNGWEMAINTLPAFGESWMIPIYVKAPASGSYTLEAEFPGAFPEGTGFMLRNNLDGSWHEISDNFSITLNLPFDTTAQLPAFTIAIHYTPAVFINHPLCEGDANGSVIFKVENDSLVACELTRLSDNQKIQLQPSAGLDTLAGLLGGDYQMVLTFFSGFEWDSMLVVSDPDPLMLDVFASQEFIYQDTATVLFTASSASAATVNWTIGNHSQQGNSVSWFFAEPGSYMVYAYQSDASGCSVSDSVRVELAGSPNGMSANFSEEGKVYFANGVLNFIGVASGRVEVVSLDGKVMFDGMAGGDTRVLAGDWASGIYLVRGTVISPVKIFLN